MWLAAGRLETAAKALDLTDLYLGTYGQRYPEGLLLLLRARLAPEADVRAALERARTLSLEREAHLFVQRADHLLGRRQ
ncbi:hypothetical protein GCM10009555_029440 [Acrocarpospora macrocephala]|uniref:Uncharacterized protein n=1 Tax=Acrocarpospora macrocephala TaxID=150177 RepID=A0A5M3WSS3_9ACTN|nr:hypothetical protein [Acrocarpospora macrocephala]GES11149.1 hypothetical protein Amac_047460 [Acrocarpospora macrocephala]